MQMKKQQAVDKWEQYGNDIQFRAVRSGPVYDWCKQFEEDVDLPERDTLAIHQVWTRKFCTNT